MAAATGISSALQVCTPAAAGAAGASRRTSSIRTVCQANKQEQTSSSSSSSAAPKGISTKFGDVLAFSGPAPERINGRLAMMGFVTAVGVELASGNDVLTQLSVGGLPWFLWMTGLLSAASLVPLFQGVSVDSVSGGVMSSKAEMWNGRMAMLGLLALALTEYIKGGPLV